MEVPLEDRFKLPRLGSESFKKLMSAGLEYESGSGFRVKRNADLVSLKAAISSEIGQDVQFTFRCFVCGDRTSCVDCAYRSTCSIEYCGRCICQSCMKKGLPGYVKAWRGLLSSTG
jgi:hypothetical protein